MLTARLLPETEVGSLPDAEAPPGGGGNTIPPIDPLAEAALGRLVATPSKIWELVISLTKYNQMVS